MKLLIVCSIIGDIRDARSTFASNKRKGGYTEKDYLSNELRRIDHCIQWCLKGDKTSTGLMFPEFGAQIRDLVKSGRDAEQLEAVCSRPGVSHTHQDLKQIACSEEVRPVGLPVQIEEM